MNRPVIAIVGRPNVGKSSIFNRLAKRAVSLVHDRAGVTRDRIFAETRLREREVMLIDTGGIGLEDESGFEEAVQKEAALALEVSQLILWVVDARDGCTPLDEEIARKLRRAGQPILVAANKADSVNQQFADADFARLGFGRVIPVSAAHGVGIGELVDAMVSRLPQVTEEEEIAERRPVRVAIVGRPNVGKSSFVNALLENQRMIVSEIAGTTRDAIEAPLAARVKGGDSFVLVDTAGMRQRRRIDDDLELAMTGRAAHAIQQADIVVLMVTADTGLTMQDKKIGALIQKAAKPCLVAVNKWDLAAGMPAVHDPARSRRSQTFAETFEDALRKELFFLSYAPVVLMSALERTGIDAWHKGIAKIARHLRTPIPTGPLNRLVQRVQQVQPPRLKANRRFKILYATCDRPEEEGLRPPRIVGFCNDPRLITKEWLAYLEQMVRAEFPLEGCPLRWTWRGRGTPKQPGGQPDIETKPHRRKERL